MRYRVIAAQQFLRKQIAASALPLASISELARRAGVSYVTMWKALAGLRAAGELDSPARGKPVTAQRSAGSGRKRWHDIRMRLIHDIVAGRFAPGSAVSCKEVTAGYGVCFRTARAALESLESGGWLGRERKRYRVRSFSSAGFGATVVLFSTVDRTRGVSSFSPRLQELVRSCEIHCSRMHLALDPVLVRRGMDTSSPHVLAIPSGPRVAGYLFWPGDLDASAAARLLARLRATGKAVSVLDEVGEIGGELLNAGGRRVALFSMANSRAAGQALGRFLLGLGHRGVGFVSYERTQPWGRNRFEGIRETYALAGFGGGVRLLSLGPERARAPVDTAVRAALEDRGMTAMVAETDAMAIVCMERLAALGARPGRDMSVAGFDDTPDAFMHNLTSYNFDCDAVMHAMLSHLFGRSVPGRGRETAAIEMEGFVTPRSSTGRPRPSGSM